MKTEYAYRDALKSTGTAHAQCLDFHGHTFENRIKILRVFRKDQCTSMNSLIRLRGLFDDLFK